MVCILAPQLSNQFGSYFPKLAIVLHQSMLTIIRLYRPQGNEDSGPNFRPQRAYGPVGGPGFAAAPHRGAWSLSQMKVQIRSSKYLEA
jgi:hypothetical protein